MLTDSMTTDAGVTGILIAPLRAFGNTHLNFFKVGDIYAVWQYNHKDDSLLKGT